MLSFDIHPFVGALPIKFGMRQADVQDRLGPPERTHPIWGGSGVTDSWSRSGMKVSYDKMGLANHIGFCPGGVELHLLGSLLWAAQRQSDPNLELLRRDPSPRETLGFLVFTKLGITTTGYHDDDESDRALTMFPCGAWDKWLKDATSPDLSRYQSELEGRA